MTLGNVSYIDVYSKPGEGVLPYMGYIGMYGPKEYGFFSRFGHK